MKDIIVDLYQGASCLIEHYHESLRELARGGARAEGAVRNSVTDVMNYGRSTKILEMR